jgi:hypothetical protein
VAKRKLHPNLETLAQKGDVSKIAEYLQEHSCDFIC